MDRVSKVPSHLSPVRAVAMAPPPRTTSPTTGPPSPWLPAARTVSTDSQSPTSKSPVAAFAVEADIGDRTEAEESGSQPSSNRLGGWTSWSTTRA